jgi:general L-amino acid transport system permease protein
MTDAPTTTDGLLVFKPKPSLPPPPATTGVIGWMRFNLFDGVGSSITTVISVLVLGYLAVGFYDWAFARAIWEASSRQECRISPTEFGTCWAGVDFWFTRFIYGRYPDTEIWRVDLAAVVFVAWMAPLWIPRVTAKVMVGFGAILIFPFLAGYLFLGGERNWFMAIMVAVSMAAFVLTMFHVVLCLLTNRGLGRWVINLSGFADKHDRTHKYPLIGLGLAAFFVVYAGIADWQTPEVGTNNWGGMFLTLVISGIGIASALPAGIVLALGRRSEMPVIRVMCVTFIELFRSVPLITVLFMATTMFPLFLPEGLVFNKLASAIVAVCLFSAAYMAETVRGGLQAIPKGQYEAAEAMGLGYWQSMGLIVMPQALKLMIPNIVGSFIGLFKDTTLVSIIGLYDLLGMISAISQDPQWIGLHHEPLFAAAMMYFIGCLAMSKYSHHLERKLGAGDRR